MGCRPTDARGRLFANLSTETGFKFAADYVMPGMPSVGVRRIHMSNDANGIPGGEGNWWLAS